MKWYFDSRTLGQLCAPQWDYNTFTYGNGAFPGPLDGSYWDTGAHFSAMAALGARPGAFLKILEGATDGLSQSFDFGIMDAGDTLRFNVVRWYDPDDLNTYTVDGTFFYYYMDSGTQYLTSIHIGAICYNNDVANPPQLAWCISPGTGKSYKAILTDPLNPTDPDSWEWDEQSTYFSEAFDSPDPGAYASSLFGMPGYERWTYNSGCGNFLLNSNIATANGGAAGYLPADYTGGNSGAEIGNGDYSRFGDNVGFGDGYTSGVLSCGLVSVYNPTTAEIYQLAQYLNSNSFWENLKKTWSDPMESIISLSLFPTAPSNAQTTASTIVLGGMNTGISSAKITGDDTTRKLYFGKIDFAERFKFKNYLDFTGTDLMIYLPYIGFRKLDPLDIIGATIELTYQVDFLNGDFLAELVSYHTGDATIVRNILAERGNCSIQIPLTSTNYMGAYGALINTGTALLSGAMGNIGGAAGGLLGAFGQKQISTERSGAVGGSAAAMGNKFAYILIDRARPAEPGGYAEAFGRPTRIWTTIEEVEGSGYVEGEIYNLSIDNMTANEKEELIRLFREGVRL